MRRREWNGAIWLWVVLAFFLLMDLYTNVPGGRKTAVKADASPGNEDIVYEPKYIALTFDDGPHPEYTVRLLDGLKERGVRASFFLIGQNIEGNEEIVKRMYEEGHLIGNHSQNHMQLTKENAEAACRQIEATNQKIYEVTGQTPEYIRPPFGSWSEELECMVPMTVTLWDIDPLDWKTQNKDKIVSHVLKYAEDGGIILLHDVYGTSVDAALEIVDRLSERGYNFVTVEDVLID